MATFSWNPTGNYYYPDAAGSYQFASGAAADAAPPPSGSLQGATNQGSASTGQMFSSVGAEGTAAAATYQQQFQAAAGSQTGTQAQQQTGQTGALGVLENELTGWGFGADAIAWAQGEIQSNRSVDQILFDLRQQPFYVNSIFGQTNAARTAAGLPVMSETDILNYKDAAMQIAHAAGLPQGFMTDTEIVKAMAGDMSTSELSQRVTTEYVNAVQALPVVRDELARMYGLSPDQITPGGLAAYYLDPTRALPVLHQQLAAANVGAAAIESGFGQIGSSYAEGLVSQGVTGDTARTGFSNVAREAQLYGQMPGQAAPLVTSAQALGAEFEKNAADITAVNRASEEAKAPFSGAGRFAETQAGVSGLGRAVSA